MRQPSTREYPNQHPNYPDKSHFTQFRQKGGTRRLGKREFDNAPRCQAWKKDHSAQCDAAAVTGFDVCRYHGAGAGKANIKLKNRRDFLAALSEISDPQSLKNVNELGIAALAKHVVAGDVVAIKYWFDQQFGGPTSTIVNEIVDKDLFAIMVQVTAKFLTGDVFNEWLASLQEAIRAGSESTTSENSPEE